MTPFRYLCIYCVICAIAARVAASETCRLPNGEQGYCINIGECESAKAELKMRLKPPLCGFDRDIPIVCCTNATSSTPERTTFEENRSQLIFTANDTSTMTSTSYDEIANQTTSLPAIFTFSNGLHKLFRAHSANATFSQSQQGLRDRYAERSNHKYIRFETEKKSSYSSQYKGRPIRFDGEVTNIFKSPTRNPFRFPYYPIKFPSPPAKISSEESSELESIETSVDNRENIEINRNETASIVSEENTESTENIEDEIVESTTTMPSSRKAEEECQRIIEYGTHFIPRTKYVTNGQNADHFEFPHMAALGYENEGDVQWQCGGSLISDRFVITAAHCTQSKYGPVKLVRLGDIDTVHDTSDDDAQIFQVSNIFVYPSYKASSHYHDIALLQLNGSVNYTRSVMPACLQIGRDFGNETLWATGWGNLYYAGDRSGVLQKVDLKLFSNKICYGKAYGRQRRLTNGVLDEMQICAGNPEEGKDTCQGDSGGPLQIKMFDHLNIYKIVGITSFGIKCGILQGIYTRVSYYIQWIEEIVWPL